MIAEVYCMPRPVLPGRDPDKNSQWSHPHGRGQVWAQEQQARSCTVLAGPPCWLLESILGQGLAQESSGRIRDRHLEGIFKEEQEVARP